MTNMRYVNFGYNVLKIVWPEFEREISEILWPQFWKPWPSILMGVSKDTTQHCTGRQEHCPSKHLWRLAILILSTQHSDPINTNFLILSTPTFWYCQHNFPILSTPTFWCYQHTQTICRNSRLQMFLRNSQQNIWSLFMLEATVEQKCILHNYRTGLDWKQFKLKIYGSATYVAPY